MAFAQLDVPVSRPTVWTPPRVLSHRFGRCEASYICYTMGINAMAASRPARISLETITVRRVPRDEQLGRSPLVHLELSKQDYPETTIDPFSPLRFPEQIQIWLRDIDSSLIEHARLQANIALVAGTHKFPIAAGHHFIVEVASDTRAKAELELGPPEREPDSTSLFMQVLGADTPDTTSLEKRCVIRQFDITFDPPLVLPNLLQTALEMRGLFEDRGITSWFKSPGARRASKLPGPGGTRQLLDLLANAALSSNRLSHVLIHKMHAEPVFRARAGRWELRLSFSGTVQLSGAPPLGFNDVVLPSMVLPVAYASIDDWISDQPLVSADLRKDSIPLDDLVDSMFAMVSSFDGQMKLRGQTPTLLVQTQLVDRTDLQVTGKLPDQLVVEGSVQGQRHANTLVVSANELSMGFPEPTVTLGLRATIENRATHGSHWLSRWRYNLENTVMAGSTIPSVQLGINTRHPFASGTSTFGMTVANVRIDGGAGGLSLCGKSVELWPMSRQVELSADFSTEHDFVIDQVGLSQRLHVPSGRGSMMVQLSTDGTWHLGLRGEGLFEIQALKHVPGVPELSIDAGELQFKMTGGASCDVQARVITTANNALDLSVLRGDVVVKLTECSASIAERSISVGPRTDVHLRCNNALLTASGLGALSVDIGWDMHDGSCWLRSGDKSVSLLAPDLRRGELTAHLSEHGRLWFTGRDEGLFGIRYFNTLLNPAANPEHVAELLRSDQALGYVMSALELLSPTLADNMSLVRDIVIGIRTIAERAGIRHLRHFIPRPSMARFFSLLLAGDDSLAPRMEAQIRSATESRGIDRIEVKNLLRLHLDEFDMDYEISGFVRWIASILQPMEPFDPSVPVALEPLSLSQPFCKELASVPSAGYIYARLQAGDVDGEFVATLCRYAPQLTLAQLEYVLTHANDSWHARGVKWLRFVRSVKARVGALADAYGGIEYALQPHVVSLFLGEAIGDGYDAALVPDRMWADQTKWPPACALGPAEIAVLLSAGLALDRQDRQTQINNRMLIDILRQRPARFTLDVLSEIGQHNPRALAAVLFAFLDQQQDHMVEPVDLAQLLEQKIGLDVPRYRDFLAGGKRARDSYWGALSKLATRVIAGTEASCAFRLHLQTQRHPVVSDGVEGSQADAPPNHAELVERAQRAIALADQTSNQCTFYSTGVLGPTREATAQYQLAFDACRDLLAADRMAFQQPWFKHFWLRNEQALRVLSVVRNFQQDVDSVRQWLRRVSGRDRWQHEQDLATTIIDALIWDPSDRTWLKQDPLVRLLIDPTDCPLDFTIVSAMGVVTEGEHGTELQDAFARLKRRRGITVVRADTGTARSLEDNARMIINSLQQVSGPFGWLGYSQGCANIMAAESTLRGGTPQQQAMVDCLVCRQFICSAFNGSFHGDYSSDKVERALVEAERFLKHYQVSVSSELATYFLRIVRALVDSPVFVRILGGVHSLTVERARNLHREMQIVDHAPTSYLQAIAEPEWLPETLEFTYNTLSHMSRGAHQDSQVLTQDQVAYSTRVINEATKQLQRCCMPSIPDRAHHWSMLSKETEFVTTPRDVERRVYDAPKDRYVFPWIDVNARFGLIKPA